MASRGASVGGVFVAATPTRFDGRSSAPGLRSAGVVRSSPGRRPMVGNCLNCRTRSSHGSSIHSISSRMIRLGRADHLLVADLEVPVRVGGAEFTGTPNMVRPRLHPPHRSTKSPATPPGIENVMRIADDVHDLAIGEQRVEEVRDHRIARATCPPNASSRAARHAGRAATGRGRAVGRATPRR